MQTAFKILLEAFPDDTDHKGPGRASGDLKFGCSFQIYPVMHNILKSLKNSYTPLPDSYRGLRNVRKLFSDFFESFTEESRSRSLLKLRIEVSVVADNFGQAYLTATQFLSTKYFDRAGIQYRFVDPEFIITSMQTYFDWIDQTGIFRGDDHHILPDRIRLLNLWISVATILGRLKGCRRLVNLKT